MGFLTNHAGQNGNGEEREDGSVVLFGQHVALETRFCLVGLNNRADEEDAELQRHPLVSTCMILCTFSNLLHDIELQLAN